jgi:hypothetical protein
MLTASKLKKLRRRVDQLRSGKGNVRSRQLIRLAFAVGRVRVVRGKEPTYEKPARPPLTIPNHPGAMAAATVDSVLDMIDADIAAEEAGSGQDR